MSTGGRKTVRSCAQADATTDQDTSGNASSASVGSATHQISDSLAKEHEAVGSPLELLFTQVSENVENSNLCLHVLGCFWNFVSVSGQALGFCMEGGLFVVHYIIRCHNAQHQLQRAGLAVLLHVISMVEYIEESWEQSILACIWVCLQTFGNNRVLGDLLCSIISCLMEKNRTSVYPLVQLGVVPHLVDISYAMARACQQKKIPATSWTTNRQEPAAWAQETGTSSNNDPFSNPFPNPPNLPQRHSSSSSYTAYPSPSAESTLLKTTNSVVPPYPVAPPPPLQNPSTQGANQTAAHLTVNDPSVVSIGAPLPSLPVSPPCSSRAAQSQSAPFFPLYESPLGAPPSPSQQPLPGVQSFTTHQAYSCITTNCCPSILPLMTPNNNLSTEQGSVPTTLQSISVQKPKGCTKVETGPAGQNNSYRGMFQGQLDNSLTPVEDVQLFGILFKALHCIFQLTCCDKAKALLCAYRAQDILLHCLNWFECDRISLACCGALWNLAMMECNRTPLRKAGCTEALLGVLSKWNKVPRRPQGQKLALRAATALYHLTRSHDDNLTYMVEIGGCEVIVQSTHDFTQDAAPVLQMLSLLLLRLSGRHTGELLNAGVIDVAIQLLAEHTPTQPICSNACGLLWNLSMMSRQGAARDARMEIGEKKGIRLLLQAIKHHTTHPEILSRAFTALWNLLDVEANMHSFEAEGGLTIAIHIIRTNRHDRELTSLIWGCLFLLLLRTHNNQLKEKLIEMSAVEALLESLQSQIHHPKFCEKAFELILRFSMGGAHRICKNNGVQLLLQGMKEHLNNDRVVAAACGTIWNLAMHDCCRGMLMKQHVVTTLTEAMAAYPESRVIQFRAITALFKLSTSVPNEIASSGGIKCMTMACTLHMDDVYLVANVLGALWNIAMVGDANQLIVGQYLGDILASIEAHYQNEDVQHRGSTLLFHLLHNARNCQAALSKAVVTDTELVLRVLLKMIHFMSTRSEPAQHSESVYLCLTCVALLLKGSLACKPVVEQVLSNTLVIGHTNETEISESYLSTLRRVLMIYNSHTRITGRFAQIVFWIAQKRSSSTFLQWMQEPPKPSIVEVFARMILQNNALDSTNCNIIDALTFVCACAPEADLVELRKTTGFFDAITSQLVSPFAHVRKKVRGLLHFLAPQQVDVLCHPELDQLLITTQRSYTYHSQPSIDNIPAPQELCSNEGCSDGFAEDGSSPWDGSSDDGRHSAPSPLVPMMQDPIQALSGSATAIAAAVALQRTLFNNRPHERNSRPLERERRSFMSRFDGSYSSSCGFLVSPTESSIGSSPRHCSAERPIESEEEVLPSPETSESLCEQQNQDSESDRSNDRSNTQTQESECEETEIQMAPVDSQSLKVQELDPQEAENPETKLSQMALEEQCPQRKPRHIYNDDNCCMVCLDEYVTGDELTEYVCGHQFHKACLEHWLRDSFVCPCCRMPLTAMLSDSGVIEMLRQKMRSIAQFSEPDSVSSGEDALQVLAGDDPISQQ